MVSEGGKLTFLVSATARAGSRPGTGRHHRAGRGDWLIAGTESGFGNRLDELECFPGFGERAIRLNGSLTPSITFRSSLRTWWWV
jgi:hypothetical protein